ncbi:hypothetical protein [Kamptonema formosum]|uniref:hypothetical protein n=1 Tax=Kamptonema formosum TaxID=331992 RepID=UPI00034B90F8|nr:hypothetical protein [Oscillatoria sp. PCC 10802]
MPVAAVLTACYYQQEFQESDFNPFSGIQLAKSLLLLPPAEIIVALIWASLPNRHAPEY